MMDFRINGGTLKIDDDNKTTVSRDIAEHINENMQVNDDGCKKPEMTIED